ncbi:hypothetical protein ZWY2020_057452 [Hordeum vulgare]|nr:hypothetical protein ZWY2020_057452 [Hordeum vulgare]
MPSRPRPTDSRKRQARGPTSFIADTWAPPAWAPPVTDGWWASLLAVRSGAGRPCARAKQVCSCVGTSDRISWRWFWVEMKEVGAERCLDPQLWHACAGGMVQMPPARSRVYYFPQGHAEHANGGGAAELAAAVGPRPLPALVLCCVAGVRFLADPDTDEVFAKIRLVPVGPGEAGFREPEGLGPLGSDPPEAREKLSSFAKTLTQSDANNGGGFSVPRYCAETIFPKLDYRADPPVQTVLAKDVHGEVWKFRHIYRGTPRRHLLTTDGAPS